MHTRIERQTAKDAKKCPKKPKKPINIGEKIIELPASFTQTASDWLFLVGCRHNSHSFVSSYPKLVPECFLVRLVQNSYLMLIVHTEAEAVATKWTRGVHRRLISAVKTVRIHLVQTAQGVAFPVSDSSWATCAAPETER